MRASHLDRTFAVLADPTRRAILARLARGQATAGELASPFTISQPAISRHIKVLARAALIARMRAGQFQRCRLKPERLGEAARWLGFYRRFWSGSFDRLEQHLRRAAKARRKTRKTRKTRKARHGKKPS